MKIGTGSTTTIIETKRDRDPFPLIRRYGWMALNYTVGMKRKTFFWLLSVSLTFAAQGQILDEPGDNEGSNTAGAHPTSAETKSMQLLARFQKPEAVLWLQADGEKFLALQQPALRGKPTGSVLLLHAAGQHPSWPGALDYLRERLPELGWNTLSIALPDPAFPKPQLADAAASQAPEEALDETEEIFDPNTATVTDGSFVPEPTTTNSKDAENVLERKAVERIVAAVEHLKSENTTIIIYGQGIGAMRAGRYWQETGDNAVRALIFVDGQNALPDNDFALTDALTNPRLPVLDVIISRALTAEIDGKQRAEQAAMMELSAYQQHWFAEDNERLANMVYGFLRRNLQ